MEHAKNVSFGVTYSKNMCLICRQFDCGEENSYYQQQQPFLETPLEIIFKSCQSLLIHETFKDCFKWSFKENKVCPLCSDCYQFLKSLFEMNQLLKEMQAGIQDFIDSFTEKTNLSHINKKSVEREHSGAAINFDTSSSARKPLEIAHGDDTTPTPESSICDNFDDQMDFDLEEKIGKSVIKDEIVVSIDLVEVSSLNSIENQNNDIPPENGFASQPVEPCRDLASFVKYTVAKQEVPIVLKEVRIILERVRFDEKRKCLNSPNENVIPPLGKRKAALAAAAACKKIVLFESSAKQTKNVSEEKRHFTHRNIDAIRAITYSEKSSDKTLLVKQTMRKDKNKIATLKTNKRRCSFLPAKRFKCQHCYMKFNFTKHFISHSLKKGHENEMFKSDPCTKIVYKQTDLLHKKMKKPLALNNVTIINNCKSFKCTICEKEFGRKVLLSKHNVLHTHKLYKCENCNEIFKWRIQLHEHNIVVHSAEKYKCEICCMEFSGKCLLHRHRMLHTKMKNKIVRNYRQRLYNGKQKRLSKRKSRIFCVVCNSIFECSRELDAHSKSMSHENKRNFQCRRCDKSFYRKVHFGYHKKCQLGDQRRDQAYKCNVCKASFPTNEELQNHRMSCKDVEFRKNELAIYECRICDKNYDLKSSLKEHRDTVHSDGIFSECDVCGMLVLNETELTNHKTIFNMSKKCSLCDESFHNLSHLGIHKQKSHYNNPILNNYECPVCDKVLETSSLLTWHLKSHEGCQLQCKICNKNFHRYHLRPHFNHVHSTDTPWKCSICNQKFNSSSRLYNHNKRVHSDVKEIQICQACGKKFKNISSLKIHIRDTCNSDQKFICEICGQRFKCKAYLRSHRNRHTGKFKCTQCTSRFVRSYALKMHVKIVHTKEIDLSCNCNICGKNFASQRSLNLHTLIHTGEKPFECTLCKKKFRKKPGLDSHLETHSGKQFKCEICGKSLLNTQALKTHKQSVHSIRFGLPVHSSKKLQCDICGKKMNRMTNLITHMRFHTGEKPYQCQQCGKTFTRSDNLKTHLKYHEKQKLKQKNRKQVTEKELTKATRTNKTPA